VIQRFNFPAKDLFRANLHQCLIVREVQFVFQGSRKRTERFAGLYRDHDGLHHEVCGRMVLILCQLVLCHRESYSDDVRELNSRKSPTARNILFSDDSRDDRDMLGTGVDGAGVMEVEVIESVSVMERNPCVAAEREF
jgi:hypothetical protein